MTKTKSTSVPSYRKVIGQWVIVEYDVEIDRPLFTKAIDQWVITEF